MRSILSDLFAVAERFNFQGNVIDVREFGSGNINHTFLVTLDSTEARHFVLQRVNTKVFRRPELVMRNMRVATEHILRRLSLSSPVAGLRWEVPRVLLTENGRDHWLGPDGSFWRAVSFIEGSQSFSVLENTDHAREVGYAVGMFHTLLSDLEPDRLADTLEGFHVTPLYLRHYDKVLAEYGSEKSPEVNFCLQFVSGRRVWSHVLEDARAAGKLSARPIHGDPKVSNIMMDTAT
ncbi:MAG TPA: aminoglycoside phosphotransferase family protein, partial [Thermodesulfovibrionales bacterium]|nr:aminoglycoside phosphotransferase family protein [Thermodesulfovibrionales bacterium]